MTANPTNLRSQMPLTAAWIDAMREAFGVEAINGPIRAGMRGKSGFWPSEAGFEVGTRTPQRGTAVTPSWRQKEKTAKPRSIHHRTL